MSISLARETIGRDGVGEPPGDQAASPPLQPVGGRALGPDLVRAAAALLVVYLHACVPYLQHPMPGLVWAVEDGSSRIVSAAFWTIELFIMPLFLLLAGFFAYRSWVSSGGAGFLASRARRLLLPLLAATILLLPLDYYVWITGWVIDGQLAADRLWKLNVPRAQRTHLLGLGHLWFLHYVFLYCVVLAMAARCRPLPEAAADGTRTFRFGVRHRPWAAGLTALVIGGWITLLFAPEVVFGFQHAFLPVPTKWIYSGTFFFGGVLVARLDPQWHAINRLAPKLVAGGAVLGWAAVLLGQWAIQRSDSRSLAFDINIASRAVLATVTVAAAWGLSLGLIGVANRLAPLLARSSACTRGITSLAAASFWIYLVHHPLVALIQIDLKLLFPHLSPVAKSLLVAGMAVGCCLVSYRLGERWLRRRPSLSEPLQRNSVEPIGQAATTAPGVHSHTSPAAAVRRAA